MKATCAGCGHEEDGCTCPSRVLSRDIEHDGVCEFVDRMGRAADEAGLTFHFASTMEGLRVEATNRKTEEVERLRSEAEYDKNTSRGRYAELLKERDDWKFRYESDHGQAELARELRAERDEARQESASLRKKLLQKERTLAVVSKGCDGIRILVYPDPAGGDGVTFVNDAANRLEEEVERRREACLAMSSVLDDLARRLGVQSKEPSELADAIEELEAEIERLQTELATANKILDESIKTGGDLRHELNEARAEAAEWKYGHARAHDGWLETQAEVERLKQECASISEEFGLPPTIRPAEGEIRRMVGALKEKETEVERLTKQLASSEAAFARWKEETVKDAARLAELNADNQRLREDINVLLGKPQPKPGKVGP